MKHVIDLLDRITLLNVITVSIRAFDQEKQKGMTIKEAQVLDEIHELVFSFLSKYNLYTNEVVFFKEHITNDHLEQLRTVHQYNYNKLKLHLT